MREKRMWRLLAAALALVLVLAVAGCGRDDDEDDGGGGADNGELSTAPGFDGKTIKLGVLSPLSGPVAVIGEPLTAGNKVWVDYVNGEGGIAGKYKVELVERDTRYEGPTAVQGYNRIKNDVTMFMQILGTPIINAVLPQLKRDDVVAGPATLDSEWVRQANLVPVGSPYQIQAINAMDYYLREEDGKNKRICSLIADDAYGEAGQQGLDFAAEELGFEIARTAKFKSGDEDVTGPIQQLRSARCEMVFLVSVPSDTGTILGTAAQVEFAPRWIGQSPSWIGALAESPLKEYLEKTFLVVAEGPEWGDESVKGMKDMIARIDQFRPNQKPDYYFGFGYNQGRAVTAVLEKAVELGDLSREGILKALTETGTVSFDGLSGDYEYTGIEERDPPRTNTIFKVNAEKPFGLESVEEGFTSEAAEKYEIE